MFLDQTKQLCRLYEIRPSRSKGQNFLISEDIYDKIIETANLDKSDTVLEVGPGLGFLTARLAKKAGKVIAVELDDKLAEVLQIGLDSQNVTNVEVVNQSILDFKVWSSFQSYSLSQIHLAPDAPHPAFGTPLLNRRGECNYKIVANLPFNITSIFLRKFLEMENKPSEMVLMLQKEVAERIVARPPDMSILAISVQFYADAEIVQIVPKNNFWPTPNVDSAIVKLKIHHPQPQNPPPSTPPVYRRGEIDEKKFFRLVRIGFSAKRKMLKNNLAGGFKMESKETGKLIEKAGFSPKIRAEELGVEEWIKLLEVFEGDVV
jgi:16S rRNA (adenine1518-N6/adenine1519-N6)-dimethyltransferase